MKLYIELYDGTIFEKPINEVKTLAFNDIGGNDEIADVVEQIIPSTPIVEEVQQEEFILDPPVEADAPVEAEAPVEPIVKEVQTEPVDEVVNEIFAPVNLQTDGNIPEQPVVKAPVEAEAPIEKRPEDFEPIPTPNASFTEI